MVYHRNHAQFERSHWRRSLLIPSWILQFLLFVGIISIAAYRLVWTLARSNFGKDSAISSTEVIWESASIGVSVLSACLAIAEVVKFVRETLTPGFMVWTYVNKTIFAGVVLGLSIWVYTGKTQPPWALAVVALSGVVCLCSAMIAAYSIRICLKLRRYDHHPINVKQYGYSSHDLEASHDAGSRDNPSQRSLSAESDNNNNSFLRQLSCPSDTPFEVDFTAVLGERRLSYDHRRDTQFEEYVVAKRASLGLKENIDHAIGTEFGWGNERPSIAGPSVRRPGSIVGNGTAAVAKAPRREDAKRVKSWTADRVLGSLQEGIDEDGDDTHGLRRGSVPIQPLRVAKTRRVASSDSGRALLGHGRQLSDDEIQPPSYH